MAKGNPRDRSKERFWRRAVRQWRQSGLSVRDFCAEHSLSEPNFYAWRRTLAQRDAQATRFVPVEVVPDDRPAATPDGSGTALELLLNSGQVLRIAVGFDGPTLQRLLSLLEEGRP